MTYGAVGGLPANATRAQVLAVLGRLKAAGAPGVDQEIAAVPQNDADIPAYVKQLNLAAASAMDQFHTRVGTPGMLTTDAGTVPYVQAPPDAPGGGGAITVAPGAVSRGVSPLDIDKPSINYVDPNDPTATQQVISLRKAMEMKGLPIPPEWGVPQAAPGAPQPAPSGAPRSATDALLPTTGRYTGAPPPQPALVPKPAAASRATAAPVPTPAPGPSSAGIPSAAAPVTTQNIKANADAYLEDKAAIGPQLTRAQNLAHAFNALREMTSATGKGAAGLNTLRSYAQTLGFANTETMNEQQLFELMHKYTTRAAVDAAGGSSTDLGKKIQEEANAGTSLANSTNMEILRNDMGKVMQGVAANLEQKDPRGLDYLDTRAKHNLATDPRGFVWDTYSDAEKAKIRAEVGERGAAHDKVAKALGIVLRHPELQITGILPQRPPAPAANPPPSLPRPNPLIPPGPQ
jgi:hypothetical protein